MDPIKNRLILVGNIWFLSSVLALNFRYRYTELKTSIKIRDEFISSQVFVWGDLEYIILPLSAIYVLPLCKTLS